MEVVVPLPRSPEFPFDSATASPYTTGPRFGEPFYHFNSAPSSPTRSKAFYTHFTTSDFPTTPHRRITDVSGDGNGYFFDFTFYPCLHQCLPEITAADELFDKARIRPLLSASPPAVAEANKLLSNRGRDRTSLSNFIRNGSRELRSLSPVRNKEPVANKGSAFPTNAASDSPKGGGTSRRWARLRDLLLFRNTSEGRVTGRGTGNDPLRKFTLLSSVPLLNRKRSGDEEKRSKGCSGCEVGSVRRGAVAAVAEEHRKKTPQTYQRHGLLLGLMPFNPAVRRSS